MQRSPIKAARRDIFHTRVDSEKRLIDEPLGETHPNEVAILYVDHHDKANEWGKAYDRDTIAALVRGIRVVKEAAVEPYAAPARPAAESRARQREIAPPVNASPKNTFGHILTERELVARGVPRQLLSRVMRCDDCIDLTTIGLSEEVAGKVENWYLSKLPSKVCAFPVPAAVSPTAVRSTLDDLAGILRLPLHRFLATLSEEQRRLAERPGTNLFIVKGAAGSGKTVVGIRRIEHYVNQRGFLPAKPILFTCYNKVLANAAAQMITDSLGQPLDEANIEVVTAFKLMSDLQMKMEGTRFATFASKDKLIPLIRSSRLAVTPSAQLARWSDEELLDEVLEVIFGRSLTSFADYAATDRKGRGRRLDTNTRKGVWEIYRHFRTACDERKVAPWDQLPARLLSLLESTPVKEPTYAAIVVDEAQDLPPSFFKLLLRLQAGDDHNIVVLGDAAQNVYRNGFRWNQTGLSVAGGQVTILRRCFRSTPTIIAATRPLVAGQLDRFEEDLILPEADGETGPKVQIHLLKDEEAEIESMANGIASTIERGVPPSSIGVLFDDTRRRRKLREALEARDCRVEEFYKNGRKSIDIFESSVKLLTTGSAKGLEFSVLFIGGVTEDSFPSFDTDGESSDRAKRSLYTAMMRSGYELYLSAPAKKESGLLRLLDANSISWVYAQAPQ